MIVLLFSAYTGAILTAGLLWSYDWHLALVLAPIGGSAASLITAAALYRCRRRPSLRVSVSLVQGARS